VFDDRDDTQRLALVVVDRLSERVLSLEDAVGESLADDDLAGRRRLLGVLGAVLDVLGIEGLATRQFDAERVHSALVDVELVHRLRVALLVGLRVHARGVAASRKRHLRDGRGVDDARHLPQHVHVGTDHVVEVEAFAETSYAQREHVVLVDARGPAHLVHALLHEEHGIDDDGQRDRDLQGHQDGSCAVARERGEDGSQFHGYCTLR
jgi:hypothetical protein